MKKSDKFISIFGLFALFIAGDVNSFVPSRSHHHHYHHQQQLSLLNCENPDIESIIMSIASPVQRVLGKIQKVDRNELAPYQIYRLYMDDNGIFPNNPIYPLLLYKSAHKGSKAEATEVIVQGKKWTHPWEWGIFTFHHYHSTAWELLLCVQGYAKVQLGGETGPTITIEKGDLALVPPGVAHKHLDSFDGLSLLGSYPAATPDVDTLRGAPTEQQRQRRPLV